MKTYKIYFRHYDRVLTVEAEYFAVESGVIKFYAVGTEIKREIYLPVESVGAIETEEVGDSSSDKVLTSGKGGSKKLHAF